MIDHAGQLEREMLGTSLVVLRREAHTPSGARERLIDAVIDLSVTVGLASVSVGDVSEASGVGRRTFYRYFGDVIQLYATAYDAIDGELRAAVWRDWTAADGDPAVVVDAVVRFACADPVRAAALFVQGPVAGDAVAEQRLATLAWLGSLLAVGDPRASPSNPLRPALHHEIACGGLWESIRTRIASGSVVALRTAAPELRAAVAAISLSRPAGRAAAVAA